MTALPAMRVEAGVVEAGDGVAQRELRGGGEREDLGGGEAVQLDFGEALLDAGEEGLVVVEGDALAGWRRWQEEAGCAHVYGLAGAGVGGVEVGVEQGRGCGRWCS